MGQCDSSWGARVIPVEGSRTVLWSQMSALGHQQTSRHVRVMSVIPFKAHLHQRGLHVRFVPIADMSAIQKKQPRWSGV